MLQNILFPICFLVALGALLRKTGFINAQFVKSGTEFMYRLLLPAYFFLIIAGGRKFTLFDWRVYTAAATSIMIIFLAAHLLNYICKIPDELSFAFTNSCYRFNVFLGIAFIFYVFNETVMHQFCIFLLFIIPVTDIFTVIGARITRKESAINGLKLGLYFKLIFLNPILLAGYLGLLASCLGISFGGYLNQSIKMLAAIISPMALILTGGALIHPQVKSLSELSVVGVGLKTIVLPVLVYLFLQLLNSKAAVFRTVVPFFALPLMLDRPIVKSAHTLRHDNTLPFSILSVVISFMSISLWLILLPG